MSELDKFIQTVSAESKKQTYIAYVGLALGLITLYLNYKELKSNRI